MKIFIVIEEDMDGARVVYSGQNKDSAEKYVIENYARDLRWLMAGVWRCGSNIISVQESILDA